MPRVARYSAPKSYRLKKEVMNQFEKFCSKAGVNESEVIQVAIRCFLRNKACMARKELTK